MDLALSQKIIDDLGVPQIVDYRKKLPQNKNYTWAQLAGYRNASDLDVIGLHHDAYPKQYRLNKSPFEMMSEIAEDHINSTRYEPKGEGGFPYHIYIMRGTAYYCNEVSWRTYGIADHNGHVVHVCMHGDYVKFDQLTEPDRRCLIAVCLTLMDQGSLPNLKQIKGHCELSSTDCPGYNYAGIRNDVMTARNRLTQSSSWNSKLAKISELGNQYNYMTNLIRAGENDGNAQWSMNMLLEVHAVLKERGLL
ncbi:peptidoglycan recognition protein family protein [Paenibacillus oleatilyticus]|uniref:N-acetylmuramoyl-L-alanine amidase n=1 Tax=Paenibacillus oleatilyticus TaxID=2594886 RepID=A0ABV4VCC3_9BACL